MGLFFRKKHQNNFGFDDYDLALSQGDPEGGKVYKTVNTCALVGIFILIGLIVLSTIGVFKFTSTLLGFLIAIIILCIGLFLVLPWVRRIEKKEFIKTSYVFIGIIALCCLLWVIGDVIVISLYKEMQALLDAGVETMTEEYHASLIGGLKYCKFTLFITLQSAIASFVGTFVTKYKNKMLVFQIISYASYLFIDIYLSCWLFAIKVDGGAGVDKVFSVSKTMLEILTNVGFLGFFILAVLYVSIASSIIVAQDRKKRKVDFMRNLSKNSNNQIEQNTKTMQTIKEKLEELKKMYESELITQEEYEKKKDDILGQM